MHNWGETLTEAMRKIDDNRYHLIREVFNPERDVEQRVMRELAGLVSPSAMFHDEDEVLAVARRVIAIARHHDPRGPQT